MRSIQEIVRAFINRRIGAALVSFQRLREIHLFGRRQVQGGAEVLINKFLINKVLGNEVLNDEVSNNEVSNNEVSNNKVLSSEVLSSDGPEQWLP
jgi:hypothetical protein